MRISTCRTGSTATGHLLHAQSRLMSAKLLADGFRTRCSTSASPRAIASSMGVATEPVATVLPGITADTRCAGCGGRAAAATVGGGSCVLPLVGEGVCCWAFEGLGEPFTGLRPFLGLLLFPASLWGKSFWVILTRDVTDAVRSAVGLDSRAVSESTCAPRPHARMC